MEKYTAFAHAATGVNPFLPRAPAPAVWKLVVLAPLIALRVAMFGLLLVVLAVVDMVPGLRNFLVPLIAHLMLTTAGFFSVNAVDNDPRRTGLQTTDPSSDDGYVVSQYQSPVDVLVACFALSAPRNFVFPTRDGRLLVVRRVVQALRVALNKEQPEVGNSDEIPADSVVFACGARTNGLGFLTWPVAVTKTSKRVGLLAVQYDATVPHTTAVSGLRYLVDLFACVGHVLRFTALGGIPADAVRPALCRVSGVLNNDRVVETDLTAEKASQFRRFFAKDTLDSKTQ